MSQTKNKPVKTLRDGGLKASIWLNEYEDRVFYTVTFARSYKKPDNSFADAHNYTSTDLLRLAKLAERAHEAIREMSAIEGWMAKSADTAAENAYAADAAGGAS